MKGRPIAGFHAVNARLKHAPDSIVALYVDASRRDARMRDLLARAEQVGVRAIQVPVQRLRGLAGDVVHQGVVALCSAEQPAVTLPDVLSKVSATTLLLLLDGVTDPRNLGACLRTADAAGATAVVVPRDRAAALSVAAQKTAAGATVPLVVVTNLARAMQDIREAGVWIVGADAQAPRTIFDIDQRGAIAWALGAEGSGLRRLTRERCDWLARIPMVGRVESLNVSVAAGICLFETVRQRGAA
ncbi:MAG: 23S rRNA (guanosine(2251)-2'-O)-methyltransferase RlmB [Sutterellaceae bacterium]|nr:23S rRNA (guanosine(2251)-2'-O)-methyltransferase RlmB [Burkholderiaceae bacterium]MCX7900787.1 23S rRNA (guanosine(2251)-2'-O)-methyltransferase RlmB [Burkholderiaceae bacterium]MDW8429075.1 23S rRNA (guanosine(2251)-2'-O)-methyltransferase RlmB [Sutterellaceae bacterium]